MTRQKKSRKVGKIGIAKSPSNVRKSTESRVRKHLGKPAGSRNNESMVTNQPVDKKVNKDPRHGSKKLVSLVVEKKGQKIASPKVKYFSPAQELDALEKDTRLATLIDKIDLGKAITRDDQQYVDQALARHKVLCDMLGLSDETEVHDEKTEKQDDLYSQFEAIDINDFKD